MNIQKNLLRSRGFTIAELLIVIVVIGILAAITIVAYNGVQQRANIATQKHSISQAERAILAQAVELGDEAEGVTGNLIGAIEGVGKEQLIRPIDSTTSGVTMYVVYAPVSVAGNYLTITSLTPSVASNGFRLQTGQAGSSYLSFRTDTATLSNNTITLQGARVAGTTVICWLQSSVASANVSVGCSNSAPQQKTLTSSDSWNFTGISTEENSNGKPKAVLVFDAVHNQATRASVMSYLAGKYLAL